MQQELDERDNLIINCLKHGKKQFRELEEELTNKGRKMSKTTLSRHLKYLESEEVIRRVPSRSPNGRSIVYYELVELSLETKVIDAVKTLRKKYLGEPTVEEIAYFVGEPPVAVLKTIYKLSRELEWRNPTEEYLEKRRLELLKLLEYMSMKEFKPNLRPPELWGDPSIDTLKVIEEYSTLFPEMIPTAHLRSDDTYILEWKEEAMKITGLTVKTTEFPTVIYSFKFEI